MAADPRYDALAAVPLFARLPPKHLRRLVRDTTIDEYPEGITVMREGAHGDTMFIILEGTARVERRGRTVTRFGPGDVFGEMAVIDARPRTATIVAESPMRCLVVYGAEFRKVVMDEPKATWALLLAVVSRYRLD